MFDDPSFSGMTEKDWTEFFKNQRKNPKNTPPPICEGCLFYQDNGSCVILDWSVQHSHINCGECDKKEP